MSATARRFLAGLLLLLGTGLVVGWLYGEPWMGFLGATFAALAFQVRQLLTFERALRTDDFSEFQVGEGIWQQIFARYRNERNRGEQRGSSNRRLLKEIRKSTNAMPDGAVILDANNEIVTCNRAAKTLAGLKRRKDRGQRIDNILRDPKLAALIGEDDADKTVEIPSPIHDDGWLNCRVVPYGAEQKLLLLRDVTERIRLAKMRRDFVANASHELRSPLTVISGYLDALADDEQLPSDWSKPVAQMQGQAQRMQQILSELMELSRLESGGMARTDESIDVGALLGSVRDDFERPREAASIVVEAASTDRLLGSMTEIESVVVNLLSNAMRYTEADGRIILRWQSDKKGGVLSVTDSGVGIAAEHIPRLTERFFRVDRGRSRGDGGIGLGLAIVKHVLMRHDAELHVESEPGKGSEFLCRFPPSRLVVAPLAAAT